MWYFFFSVFNILRYLILLDFDDMVQFYVFELENKIRNVIILFVKCKNNILNDLNEIEFVFDYLYLNRGFIF